VKKKVNAYFYDISVHGLSEPEKFYRQARRAINEISQVVGLDSYTRLSLEPVSAQKHVFSLTIQSEAVGHPIAISKQGKRVSSLLSKAKKSMIKIARNIQQREIRERRRAGRRRFSAPILWEAS